MQDRRYTEWFRFVSQGLPADTFHVVRFTGTEGLNALFSFTIQLVSANLAVDTAAVLNASATFTILREGAPDAVFSGYPARVEQGGHFNGYTYYTVELRPALWKLTQVVQSAIFLNQNVREVSDSLLSAQTFFSIPHEFRLMRDYPSPEFAMQYEESVYDYILWRMEEQGAYFYFAPDGDKVIFADAPQSHGEASATVFYSPTTGLEGDRREEVVSAFSLSQTPLPHQVVVRSYDWKAPNRVIVGMAAVSDTGIGDVYLANENVESEADANRLAAIRSEELVCRSRTFTGMGSVPILRPGVTFTLNSHYNPAFNRDYLVTGITHEGGQEAFLTLGLGIPMHGAKDHLFYRNTFSCIESDVPYRPARKAPRSKVSGVIRAFVDGAGSGARAELDEYGRYKLLFPFDISGRKGGNASCWIRMAQPQVGKDSGLSLPLLPGTEVIVSFIDGNPDRPVITGALANGETGAITGAGNSNFSGLRTPGGNQITINDTDTKQGISLLSASGHGLTMTSGSMDCTTNSTDVGLSAASVASSDIANISKSVVAGYQVSHKASQEVKWWQVGCKFLSGAVADTLDTLSAKASQAETASGLRWGASGSKMLGLAIPALYNIKKTHDARKSLEVSTYDYGVSLTAKKDSSNSVLQVHPSTAQRVASWIALLFRIGKPALDTPNESINAYNLSEDKSKDRYVDSITTCMDDLEKADEEKQQPKNGVPEKPKEYDKGWERSKVNENPCAYYNTIISHMSSLISNKMKVAEKKLQDDKDKTAYNVSLNNIAELKKHKSMLEKQWNIFCNDNSQNLDYHTYAKPNAIRKAVVSSVVDLLPEFLASILCIANTVKSQKTTLGGISLNSPDNNINLNANKVITQHSDQGIILHAGGVKKQAAAASEPQSLDAIIQPFYSHVPQISEPDATCWGGGENGIDGRFMKSDLDTFFGVDKENMGHLNPTTEKYLAFCAPLQYSKAKYNAVFADKYRFFGDDYIVRTGSKATTLKMDKSNFSIKNPNEDAKMSLSVNTAYDNVEVKNAIGLTMDKDSISLNHKENASLILHIEKKTATLLGGNGNNKIILNNDEMNIEGAEINIRSTQDVSINYENGNAVKIAGVEFKSSELKSKTGPLTLDGNVIKIG